MHIGLIIPHVKDGLGPGDRLCIWTAGCNKRCPGCISKELWDKDSALDIDIIKYLSQYVLSDFDGVTISGGEPFLQIAELSSLVDYLSENGVDDILVYSGMKYEELINLPLVVNIFKKIAVLVEGEFQKENDKGERLRGSDNQRIIAFNKKYESRYLEYNQQPRNPQLFEVNGYYVGVGVPLQGKEN